MNKLSSEIAALVGVIDPQSAVAGAYTSGYVPLKNFHRFLAVLQTGAMTATSTVDAKLTVYTSGAGAGPLDVPGAAITQLTAAGVDGSKQVEINLNTDTLAGSVKYTHMRLTVTVAVAASLISAQVWGFSPRYSPASDNDLAAVDEIVSA